MAMLTARIMRTSLTFTRAYTDAKKGWARAKQAADDATASSDDPKVPSKALGYLNLALTVCNVSHSVHDASTSIQLTRRRLQCLSSHLGAHLEISLL